MLVTEDVRWQRCLPALDTIEVLYLEFVSLDAAVLAGMPCLRELRLLFDAWEVTNAHTFSKLPRLDTIYLEPATANTLPVDVRAAPPALGTGFNGSRAAPAFHIVLVRPGRCRRLLPAHAAACPTCVHG